MANYKTLAASPVFGGNMTRPHRIVLVEKEAPLIGGKEWVVWVEYQDAFGGVDSGDYYTDPVKAALRWAERSQRYCNEYAKFMTFQEV